MNIVNVGYDSTNYYVTEQGRGRILVDVGWPGTLPRLLGALRRKGLSPTKLDAYLVAHFHPDHAGMARDLNNLDVHTVYPGHSPVGVIAA